MLLLWLYLFVYLFSLTLIFNPYNGITAKSNSNSVGVVGITTENNSNSVGLVGIMVVFLCAFPFLLRIFLFVTMVFLFHESGLSDVIARRCEKYRRWSNLFSRHIDLEGERRNCRTS